MYVAIDGHVVGRLRLADELRPDAAATIAGLQSQGVQTVMLSGVYCLTVMHLEPQHAGLQTHSLQIIMLTCNMFGIIFMSM